MREGNSNRNNYSNRKNNIAKKNPSIRNNRSSSEMGIDTVLPEECFNICENVTNVNMDVIPVRHIPKEGDVAYTIANVEIHILEEIGRGGEGCVYKTNSPFLAKIYKPDHITNRIKGKIELMLSKRIECDGICYPVAALYNKYKEFVGYLMPLAKGKELQKCVFMPKLLQKNFPDWKKRDLVELSITILEKIKYLHDRNIIIGDINPNNILVVSQKEVYIVDTDSFQVEDFPCPVGTVNFTAPEIQKQHFDGFLRSKGNENFAVATLLFMLMLPGKPPYAQQGGEDPVSNIINMDFSYPYGGESNKKTPDGPWRYMWSHLDTNLKERFFESFKKEGKYSEEKNRLSVDQWIETFTSYLRILDNGFMGDFDPMSEELFPVRTKKWKSDVDITRCRICKKEEIAMYCQRGICPNCVKRITQYKCRRCGTRFKVSINEYMDHNRRGWSVPDLCDECLYKITSRRCSDCGRAFNLSRSDYSYFMSKGYNLPKRCESCRNTRRR